MPHATCAHCQSQIVDHSTMVEQNGQTYCCNNCAQAMSGPTAPDQGSATCAHCQTPIVDTSTQVVRNGLTFCCDNCAIAMAQGAGQSMGSQTTP
jgi:hypothetical protein